MIFKRMSIFIFGVFSLWMLGVVAGCALQDKLLFHPDTSPLNPTPEGVQKLTLATPDGETIYAFYKPAARPECPVIVFLHGNAGRIDRNLYRFDRLAPHGVGLMLVGWRGYAGATGKPTEAGFHIDARTSWDWLVGEGGLTASQIIVHGLSIGTGPATKLARDVTPAALVLEAPYYSMQDLVSRKTRVLPVSRILKHTFRTDQWIVDVKAPILLAHGERDRLIPSSNSKRLAQIAPEPFTAWYSEEADHNNLTENGMYEEAIMPFLTEHAIDCKL